MSIAAEIIARRWGGGGRPLPRAAGASTTTTDKGDKVGGNVALIFNEHRVYRSTITTLSGRWIGAIDVAYVGTRVARVEDARLLTGHGTFVDDIVRPGHAARLLRAQPLRPGPRSSASTPSAALALRRRPRRVHRRRPQPRRPRAVAHVDRQGHPGHAPAAARRGRGPLRRRSGRARRRREPLHRRGRGRAGRGRLRAAARRRRLRDGRRRPTRARPRGATAGNVAGELRGLPARAVDEAFAAAAHVVDETIHQQAYVPVPMETRGIVVEWSRHRRADDLGRRPRRPTRCGCSAPGCSACPSTASG